jgi:hypothetical protein
MPSLTDLRIRHIWSHLFVLPITLRHLLLQRVDEEQAPARPIIRALGLTAVPPPLESLRVPSVALHVDDLTAFASTLQVLVCEELSDAPKESATVRFPRLRMLECGMLCSAVSFPYGFVAQCPQFRITCGANRHSIPRLAVHARRMSTAGWMELRGRDQNFAAHFVDLLATVYHLARLPQCVHTLVMHNCRHYRTCANVLNVLVGVEALHVSADLAVLADTDYLEQRAAQCTQKKKPQRIRADGRHATHSTAPVHGPP